jgi:hypothetical protein
MAGALLMLGSVMEVVLFMYGAARRSYMAIALPVMLALAGVSALAFWIGWTMYNSEGELPDEIEEEAGVGL